MTKHLPVFTLLSLLLVGCAGTGLHQQSVSLASERIEIVVSTDSSSMTNFVILRAANDTLFNSSQNVTLLFVRSDKTVARMPMTSSSMGAPGRSETVTTIITGRMSERSVPKYDSMLIEVTKNGSNHRYGVDKDPLRSTSWTLRNQQFYGTPQDSSGVQLLTYYSYDSSGYTFTATAVRRRVIPGEYFPSSEQLRIRIINGKGAIVWSSNEGLAFLTMIYPVEPQGVGESHEYSLPWNGIQSDGTPISPGRYLIEYTLPTKPLSYSMSVFGTFPLE